MSQPTPLLTTKLYIPPARTDLVPRPRLTEQLNESGGRKLTIISAPAGFGKTTLLSEWIAELTTRSVAWVSLDEDDNDPVRFWSYVVAALETVYAGVGDYVGRLLRSPQISPTASTPLSETEWTVLASRGETERAEMTARGEVEWMGSVLTALINEIAAVPDPFVLVLDDFHVIEASAVHNALIFLLDHLPPQMRLVVASRADLPLPLPRLRAQGELIELRADDLRFTPDEVATFLNQVMGLGLSAEDVAVLEARTEGWIAGLQLAALAMKAPPSVPSQEKNFVQAFAGSHRYILDYLVEEVLSRQPQDVQTFLVNTSILDQLSGPLCEAVTGQSGGQATLERLERANLFVVPLDGERRWYRYHHLFADFLRARLRQTHPDRLRTLHRSASGWYEENELVAEAVDHALAAEDFERAARLIDQVAEATLMRSEIATFLGWVEELPDQVARAWPSLCLFHAWAHLLAGRPLDVVRSHLEDLVEDSDLIPGKMAALRAFIAVCQGEVSLAVELSHQALDELPEDDLFLRSVVALNLSMPHSLSGDAVAASRAWAEAAQISQRAGNTLVAIAARCQQAEEHVTQGKLYKAEAIYRRALEMATDRQGRRLPIAAAALIGLGELSRQWNDLQAATRYLTQGIALTQQWGEIGNLEGFICLARVRQTQGDVEGARDVISRAKELALEFDVTELDDLIVAAHEVRMWVAQGDVDSALQWAEERGWNVPIGSREFEARLQSLPYPLRESESIAVARLRMAQGQPGEALAVLDPLLPEAEKLGRSGSAIEILTLQALAYQAKEEVSLAVTLLERALSLAEPEDYVRVFLDEGEPMAELLRQAVSREIVSDYVAKLLAAFEKEHRPQAVDRGPSSVVRRPPSLVESLSAREMDVLRLLAAGLSNQEIAQEIVVTVGTVKWHLHNIYGKLGVRSRVQAVARARELELLDR